MLAFVIVMLSGRMMFNRDSVIILGDPTMFTRKWTQLP